MPTLNVYASNHIQFSNIQSKHTKSALIELKEEIDKSTIILGDSNTSLSAMDGKNRKSSRLQKI